MHNEVPGTEGRRGGGWLRRPVFWLFFLALVTRWIVLVDYGASPFFAAPSWDAEVYHEWARAIAAGDVLGSEIFHRAPLYPYVLGLLIRIFGDRFLVIYLVQGLLSALTAVLVYELGRRVHSRRAGMVAGLLFTFYGMLAFYTVKLLPVTLSVFLHVLLVFLLLREATRRNLVAAGSVLGLLILCRPFAMLFVPFALAYLVAGAVNTTRPDARGGGAGWRGPAVRRLVAFLLPVALLLGLTLARNAYVGRDLVLVSANAGENFYVGNHANADGVFVHAAGMGSVRSQGRDIRAEAERRRGKELTPSEASTFWFRQGLSFVVRNPARYAVLLLKKLRHFVSGAERSSMYYVWFEREVFTPSLRLFVVNFYLLFPLAAAGMVCALRAWRRFALLYAMGIYTVLNVLIFFHDVRFRLPLIPFLMVFGAVGGVELYAVFRRSGWRGVIARPVLVLAAAGVVSAWMHAVDEREPDFVRSHLYTAVGDAYYDRGRLDEANTAYGRAHALNTTFPLPVFSMIKVAFARGRKDEAVRMYETYFPELGAHYQKVVRDDRDFDPLRAYQREKVSTRTGSPR